MEKKEIQRLLLVFGMVFVIALIGDFAGEGIIKNHTISRGDQEDDEKSVSLEVSVDGIWNGKEYTVEVAPYLVTREEASLYLQQAKEEIDTSFKAERGRLCIQEQYASGMVEASWNFSPYGYVGPDGVLKAGVLQKEQLIQVEVELSCGNYEEIYSFPFILEAEKQSKEQRMQASLDAWFQQQMAMEGSHAVQLPEELEGISFEWKEKKDYQTPGIFLLEIIALLAIFYGKKKEKEDAEKKRKLLMEAEYPEIVSQLQLLLEVGMTTRQAWGRIASQYLEMKKQNKEAENEIYEHIVTMSYRLQEGENERGAYEAFISEVEIQKYRRLMRMLLNNLEKGSAGICEYLEEESRQAYEQHLLLAKKLGEEASTKMLFPLMLMMTLVMVIVMAPALIGFSI